VDIFPVLGRLAERRHDPVPACVRPRQRLAARQVEAVGDGARLVALAHRDIAEQADMAPEAPQIRQMPGDAASRQIGREARRSRRVLLQPILDRPGELRQEIGRDHQIDRRVGDKIRDRITAPLCLPGKPGHDAGEIARHQPDLRSPCHAEPHQRQVHDIDEDDLLERLAELVERNVAHQARAQHQHLAAALKPGHDLAHRRLAARVVPGPEPAVANAARPERDALPEQAEAARRPVDRGREVERELGDDHAPLRSGRRAPPPARAPRHAHQGR
jgi:hypothetical protein